jgi:mannan endo-1,4-beta-mannosidase
MNKKRRSELKNGAAALIVVVIFAAVLIPAYSALTNQATLAEIKPELDAAVSSCFKTLRQTVESDLVYLEQSNPQAYFLINKYDGYKIEVPSDWKLDNTNLEYVTNLYNDNFKLSIFKEEVDLSYDSTQTYISYSNYRISQNYGTMVLLANETKSIGPYIAQTICWKRGKIAATENDLNHYYESNIVLDNKTILTFLLKSNEEMMKEYVQTAEETISRLQFIDQNRNQTASVFFKDIPAATLTGKTVTLRIPNGKCLFGLYHAPHNNYTKELTGLEEDLDFKFELIMDYYNFTVPFKEAKKSILPLYKDKRTMLITLQPFITRTAKDHNGSCLIPEIANGDYDEFLFEWASGLKEMGEPVFLRFANEMNGDWAEWCSWFYSLDPDLYIMAWNRIYTLFEKVGADNVYFVWNPHDRTYPDYNWNKDYLYYPGDNEVDWIGLTAYNNGVTRPNEEWRDFEECYSQLYSDYMSRYYLKPFMIAEFACNEIGGDKSEWITQGFRLLKENYPNIRIAVWWNGADATWIYDIDSTEQAKEAFKEALRNQCFQLDAVT